jgi:hypothetical protein
MLLAVSFFNNIIQLRLSSFNKTLTFFGKLMMKGYLN